MKLKTLTPWTVAQFRFYPYLLGGKINKRLVSVITRKVIFSSLDPQFYFLRQHLDKLLSHTFLFLKKKKSLLPFIMLI